MTHLRHNKFAAVWTRLLLVTATTALLLVSSISHAGINGVAGQSFTLSAKEGYISVADGGSVYSWGYTNGDAMQLPGPTLIVTQGILVTITLTNNLPAAAGNVSIVFPGQDVTVSGGVAGDLTQEAQTGGSVTYEFTPLEPGTYQYHSGTQPDLQVEMGLFGALIVRPASATLGCTVPPANVGPAAEADDSGRAYDHPDACFDREYLFVLSEIDMDIHQAAELQRGGTGPIVLPAGAYQSEYWLMNGRAGPDTMAGSLSGVLPTQPYSSITRMHPGERVLVRVVGAGREMHPFHTHGNHSRLLARDGRMLLTATTDKLAGPLLFTIPSLPGGTADAIFEWTGKDLGWDMYGTVADGMDPHNCVDLVNNVTPTVLVPDGYADLDSDYPSEWCADHNRPIPVTLPSLSSLAFGGFYSGSPYLGALGSLPPGEGGLNPAAGFAYMWHSHTERELVNNDVFPGGMMTMLIVEAPFIEISKTE